MFKRDGVKLGHNVFHFDDGGVVLSDEVVELGAIID